MTPDGPGQPAQHDLPCAALCAAMGHGVAGPVPPDVVAASVSAVCQRGHWPGQPMGAAADRAHRHPCSARTAARLTSDRFEPSVARHSSDGSRSERAQRTSISEQYDEIHSAGCCLCLDRELGLRPRVQGRFDRDQTSLGPRHAEGLGSRRRLHDADQHRQRARPADRRHQRGRGQIRNPRDVDGRRRDEDAHAAQGRSRSSPARPSNSSPAPIT